MAYEVITPAEIARQLVSRTASPGGLYVLASQWVSERLAELLSATNFRQLFRAGQLYLPAPISQGTVTVTLNSQQVTGDATANAQWRAIEGAPDSFIAQWFRVLSGTVWSRIVEVDASTNPNSWTLYLETPYAAEQGFGVFSNGTVVSNLSYYIVPRFVDLAPDCRFVSSMVLDALFRELQQTTEADLDRMYASRFLVAFPPRYYAIVGSALDDTFQPKVAEFYPYPQSSCTVHYGYFAHPPKLSMYDPIPPTIDPHVLRTGALADLYNWKACNALEMGNFDVGNSYRNYSNQEETKFRDKLMQAIRSDRGADDNLWIVKRRGSRRGTGDYDPVTDAYSNFLSRGY